jgi:trimethylamine--corrinoid protein Co-methyltransferase
MRRGDYAGLPRREGIAAPPLSEGDLHDIHMGTLEVLERTGVLVEAADARAVFRDGGCIVDGATGIVRIPAHAVEEAIRSTPPLIRWCGRDPRHDLMLGGGRLAFMNFGEAPKVNDLATGENRPARVADVADICTVVDWASDIDVYEAAITPRDCPEELATVHHLAAALPHMTKPMMFGPLSKLELRTCLELAAAVAGGADELRARPFLGMGMCSLSPLQLTEQGTDVCLFAARHGVPLSILAMCMSGGTTPQTLAGTLVVHNAEVLAGVVMVQLAERGAPVIYSSSSTAMDLRLGTASVGTPETALLNACVAQLSARYQMPCWVAGL